jgi:hypothetical protein
MVDRKGGQVNSKLLFQKLLVAFIVSFLGALVTSLEGLSKQPTFGWSKAIIVSILVGALGAGVRAVLALGPINLVASDKQHSLIRVGRRKV